MLSNLIKITSLIFSLIFLSFLFPQWNNIPQTASLDIKNQIEQKEEIQKTEEPIVLDAVSACVFDWRKDNYLFELNSTTQLPLASLTKLMTALIAKEYFPETTLIEITEQALAMDGDNNFKRGEFWTLSDLVQVMLISSSNDAAFAIAEALPDFLNLMNKKTKGLNLQQTYFLNPTGLDNLSKETAGGYGSCQNMVELVKYILTAEPNLLEVTTNTSIYFGDREFKNTNKLLEKLPTLYAGKTGYDELAGGNLIVAVDKGLGHPIIIAVLGSTLDGRFEDVEKLYNRFVKSGN